MSDPRVSKRCGLAYIEDMQVAASGKAPHRTSRWQTAANSEGSSWSNGIDPPLPSQPMAVARASVPTRCATAANVRLSMTARYPEREPTSVSGRNDRRRGRRRRGFGIGRLGVGGVAAVFLEAADAGAGLAHL